MRAELLQRVREQIERVVQATPETQPKVLETEATNIAARVMESQAALDNAKKVSLTQLSLDESHSVLGSSTSSSGSKTDHPFPSLSPPRYMISSTEKLNRKPMSNGSPSSTSTEQPTGRLSQISQIFSRRKRHSGVQSETLFRQPSSQVASSVPGSPLSRPRTHLRPHSSILYHLSPILRMFMDFKG
jgi:protein HOOK3